MTGLEPLFVPEDRASVLTFEKVNMAHNTKRGFITIQALGFILGLGMASRAADRPPVVGIAHIAFQVSDLAKAQAFCGGLLGHEDAF